MDWAAGTARPSPARPPRSAAVLRQPKALASALPAAPDVVALQLVLHAVGEDAAAKLLRAAEQALAPHGALLGSHPPPPGTMAPQLCVYPNVFRPPVPGE